MKVTTLFIVIPAVLFPMAGAETSARQENAVPGFRDRIFGAQIPRYTIWPVPNV
jgi:hypothetical protein